jgi:Flp pilus assembly protein CpaB
LHPASAVPQRHSRAAARKKESNTADFSCFGGGGTSPPAGTPIRPGYFRWHEVDPGEACPGASHRNESSETEYLGAIVARDFAKGDPLATAGLVKITGRLFLSAMLMPGMRGVTIAVDAPRSSSGMVLPGGRVDVLPQNLGCIASLSNDPARKPAETHNLFQGLISGRCGGPATAALLGP